MSHCQATYSCCSFCIKVWKGVCFVCYLISFYYCKRDAVHNNRCMPPHAAFVINVVKHIVSIHASSFTRHKEYYYDSMYETFNRYLFYVSTHIILPFWKDSVDELVKLSSGFNVILKWNMLLVCTFTRIMQEKRHFSNAYPDDNELVENYIVY